MVFRSLAVASLIGTLAAETAFAADSITFQLQNSTGRTLSRLSSSCLPSGSTCSIPSSIASGAIANVTINSVNGATVGPLMIARYGYSSGGTTYSCQLQVRATKDSSNPTVCVSSSKSFLKTDGTATAPVCGSVTASPSNSDLDCDYVFSATMN